MFYKIASVLGLTFLYVNGALKGGHAWGNNSIAVIPDQGCGPMVMDQYSHQFAPLLQFQEAMNGLDWKESESEVCAQQKEPSKPIRFSKRNVKAQDQSSHTSLSLYSYDGGRETFLYSVRPGMTGGGVRGINDWVVANEDRNPNVLKPNECDLFVKDETTGLYASWLELHSDVDAHARDRYNPPTGQNLSWRSRESVVRDLCQTRPRRDCP